MTRKLRRTGFWAVFCAGFIAACIFATSGGCVRHFAENKAAARVNDLLPRYIGPADKWETKIKASNIQALGRGHIKSVHIEGQNVLLDTNFKAESVTLDFSEVAVDLKKNTLQNIGAATFSCSIGPENLNTYVRSLRASGLRDLQVGLTDDRMTVSVRPEVLGFAPVPVQVIGFLTPTETGTALDFTPDSARVAIVPVPGLILPFIADRLNPAVDLKGLRIPVKVTRTVVSHGSLVIRGTIAPDDLRRAAQSPSP